MKKSLYLTTALVAAGFMTLGATDVAAAGKKGKMAITGTYKALAGYAKQQGAFENLQTGTSRNSYNTIDFKTDSEIHFKASHVTDGGFKVGVFVELETDQASTATIDGSGVTLGGGFEPIGFLPELIFDPIFEPIFVNPIFEPTPGAGDNLANSPPTLTPFSSLVLSLISSLIRVANIMIYLMYFQYNYQKVVQEISQLFLLVLV